MKDFSENKRPSAVFLSKPGRDIVTQHPSIY